MAAGQSVTREAESKQDMDYAIGIDIGGTNVKSVAVLRDGTLVSQETFESGDASNAWAYSTARHIDALEEKMGRATWIGVASPGLAARDGRSIAWMQGRMAGVQGFDWTTHLGRDSAVPVLNDAQAALLGEIWLGAARGLRDVVLLTLGTGVGGAICCDGRLLKGHLGRAGHLGHISLNIDGTPDIVNTPGSLEDAIGDHTVSHRSAGRFASTRDLAAAARAGDPDARAIWMRSIQALACGIVSIINAVDPEAILIGGGMAKAGDELFVPLRDFLSKYEWRPMSDPVRIVPAQLGDMAGAVGAAWNAINLKSGADR